jgi:glycosyltransferase involved in cell wall biosynthesis
MQILFLTPTFPYPLDNGNRILVFNTIKRLAKQHQVFLLSFIQGNQSEYFPYLKDYCAGIETVSTPDLGIWGKDMNYSKNGLIKNLFYPLPFTISRWYLPEMEQKLKGMVLKNKCDMVQMEALHLVQYSKFIGNTPVILRLHNVESRMMERYYKYASHPLERAYAYLQWKKLHRYERKSCLDSDMVITLSLADKDALGKLSPKINPEVVPVGVDLVYFKAFFSARKSDEIIYIGNLYFPPVFESMLYFLKETWPKIKRIRPQARLSILGNCPKNKTKSIRNFPDVIFLGEVDDVRPLMAVSTLTIVPHRIASGVRFKILEAMAMRLPVVSTSIGCEGLEVADGENIFIADRPETFARRVVALLENENLRNNLTEKAYALVKDNYTWENVGQRLNRIYENLHMEVKGKNKKGGIKIPPLS